MRHLLESSKVMQQTDKGVEYIWEIVFYNEQTDMIERVQRPEIVYKTLDVEPEESEESETVNDEEFFVEGI